MNRLLVFIFIFLLCYIYFMFTMFVSIFDCMNTMKVNRIQIPKDATGAYDWGTTPITGIILWNIKNCASEINQKTVLTLNDKLPPDVLEPKLNKIQSDELYYITETLFSHLEKRGLVYFPVFGSLLASFRNKISILPWDDDLDIVVDNRDYNFMEKFTNH